VQKTAMEHSNISASVEYVNFIMNHAPQFGIDANEVYGEAGFDPALLETTGARIPFPQFVRLWKVLEDKNVDPDLGLHLGEKAFAFPGHILFVLMLNAPTIKDAIEKFCRYFNLLNDITTPVFSFNSNLATLSIHFHTNDFKPSRQIFEGILAAYTSVLHRICRSTQKEIHEITHSTKSNHKAGSVMALPCDFVVRHVVSGTLLSKEID
jgi:hypothetical protein